MMNLAFSLAVFAASASANVYGKSFFKDLSAVPEVANVDFSVEHYVAELESYINKPKTVEDIINDKVQEAFETLYRIRPVPKHKGRHIPAGFCGNDYSVSGYYPVGPEGESEYFYWVFPSQQDAENDPVVLWLTGGPGCSGMVAAFHEMGPCKVDKEKKGSTIVNEYSWNKKATMIFVDQPAGVGFSTGDINKTNSEEEVAGQMYDFLQQFLDSNPELRKNDFYIFGESFGGHYVPAVANKINEENKALNKVGLAADIVELSTLIKKRIFGHLGEVKKLEHIKEKAFNSVINLQGIAIGNGLSDAIVQYPQYVDFLYQNGLKKQLVPEEDMNNILASSSECMQGISKCRGFGVEERFVESEKSFCFDTMNKCNALFMMPVMKKNYNLFDIRKECIQYPTCYDFDDIIEHLNSENVQKTLGVQKKWEMCNMNVHMHLSHEWMRNFSPDFNSLMENGVRVLLYAGDMDFSVNYLGVKALAKSIKWWGRPEFLASDDLLWTHNGNKAGLIRQFGPLTFVQVHKAGHMVPMDRPDVALAMMSDFISHKDLSYRYFDK